MTRETVVFVCCSKQSCKTGHASSPLRVAVRTQYAPGAERAPVQEVNLLVVVVTRAAAADAVLRARR
jgi:hypothetical protein